MAFPSEAFICGYRVSFGIYTGCRGSFPYDRYRPRRGECLRTDSEQETLASGIPPQVVMKWTGHSDYQAMKPYIEIAEKTKADVMKLFETEMEKEE